MVYRMVSLPAVPALFSEAASDNLRLCWCMQLLRLPPSLQEIRIAKSVLYAVRWVIPAQSIEITPPLTIRLTAPGGLKSETCGGPLRLSLYYNPSIGRRFSKRDDDEFGLEDRSTWQE